MRKGLASIVQIVILTALSFTSLILILSYVKGLSNDLNEQLSPVVDCINQRSKISNVCLNDNGKLEAKLNVALDEKVSELKFSINDESFSCNNQCGSCKVIDKEGSKTVYLIPTKVSEGDDIIFAINNCNPEQIKISKC
jgi:hypothetical protein